MERGIREGMPQAFRTRDGMVANDRVFRISLQPELERANAALTLWEIAAWLDANPDKRPFKRNFFSFVKRWFQKNEARERQGDWLDELSKELLRNCYGVDCA